MDQTQVVKVSYPTWQWRFWHNCFAVGIGLILSLAADDMKYTQAHSIVWGIVLLFGCIGAYLLGKKGSGKLDKASRLLGVVFYGAFIFLFWCFIMRASALFADSFGLRSWPWRDLMLGGVCIVYVSWLEVVFWGWPPSNSPILIFALSFRWWAKVYLFLSPTGRRVSKGARWLEEEKSVNLNTINWREMNMEKWHLSILYLTLPELRGVTFLSIFNQLGGEDFGFWKHAYWQDRDDYAGTSRLTRAWRILLRMKELERNKAEN